MKLPHYSCKGVCERDPRIMRTMENKILRYFGYGAKKKCTVCDVLFRENPEINCHCCGNRFTTRPFSNNTKLKKMKQHARY
jgi:rRNA maturation endonuclease Nob1